MAGFQRDFDAGTVSVDEMACAYGPFAAMRPDTVEFAGHWLDRHGSPYAKVAKAIALARYSQEVRGPNPASLTYVGALVEARALQLEAGQLAEEAVSERPKLAAVLAADLRSDEPEPLAALLHNPIDPNLIRILEAQTDVDLVALTERLLIAFPYDPDHWQLYASVRTLSAEDIETVRINQLVYANQTPSALLSFLQWKITDVATGGSVCPFVRAYRMHKRACSLSRDRACDVTVQDAEAFDVTFDQATASGACFDERNLPVSQLAFSALPLPR